MLDELYEVHADDEPFDGVVDDPMIARTLLIEYQRNERKGKMLARTARSVADEYARRLRAVTDRQDEIRDMLRAFVEANGTVSFPEVGGVHARRVKPKLEVVEPSLFAQWCREQGYLKEPEPDVAAGKAAALEAGEVPPGAMIEPETTDISIRKA